MSIIIREAGLDDIAPIVELEQGFAAEDRFPAKTWLRLMQGHSCVHVVKKDLKLVGAAVHLFRKGSSVARLYSISVAPEARGQGLAQLLMAHGEDVAREKVCTRMRLEVRESNEAAISLYKRSGYRVIAKIEGYYPDGEAAQRMEKVLT
ncbi:GNAT family N-acetyltransferase [Hirschia litorea]|uniref:GNAT family N-acetyltransferase n=1 Tax=Hirschia litorea TaxID=1199156 RepID=A0ABW2ILN7_9PROT